MDPDFQFTWNLNVYITINPYYTYIGKSNVTKNLILMAALVGIALVLNSKKACKDKCSQMKPIAFFLYFWDINITVIYFKRHQK